MSSSLWVIRRRAVWPWRCCQFSRMSVLLTQPSSCHSGTGTLGRRWEASRTRGLGLCSSTVAGTLLLIRGNRSVNQLCSINLFPIIIYQSANECIPNKLNPCKFTFCCNYLNFLFRSHTWRRSTPFTTPCCWLALWRGLYAFGIVPLPLTITKQPTLLSQHLVW